MKKLYGFLLYIFCLPVCLAAQYHNGKSPENESLKNQNHPNKWVDKGDIHLRWYPYALINIYDLSLTVGGEYSYAANKSMILDVGYIMASVLGDASWDMNSATGIVLKTTHRWYYGKGKQGSFVDIEAGFKTAKYKGQEEWVGRDVVNGIPAYEELMQVTSRKDVFTFGARMGKRIAFSPTGPVNLELWWGLGIRYRHYYLNLPEGSQWEPPRPWIFNPFNYDESWFPDFQMGLRLTFRVKPKNL